MKEWDENSDKVSRITPNKELAKSLLKMSELREKDIASKNEEFATLIVEGLYEIAKELITAIMSIEGYKTTSHELLVGYIAKFYSKQFTTAEIHTIDQLRKTRNDIDYRGIMINPEYLARNRKDIGNITLKLKQIVKEKVK